MSYTLKLTDGKILLTLADQQFDRVSTSLTLIGKNVNAYGDDLNSNFIHLLENFANTGLQNTPTNPLVGQLYFDKDTQRLLVYSTALQWKPVGSPILSASTPSDLSAGDFWFDVTNKQLNFFDGSNLNVIGPPYSFALGKSGVVVEAVVDSNNANQTISTIYSNGLPLGIISSSSFTLRTDYQQFYNGITNVSAGITAAPGIKFVGTATNTDNFNNLNVADLVVNNLTSPQTVISPISIHNDGGLTIGTNDDLTISVDSGRAVSLALGNVQDFAIYANSLTQSDIPAFYVTSSTGYVGLFTTTPNSPLEVNGNVTIDGNLTVNGTATYVTVQDLYITDRYISIANSATTDAYAIGAGIYLLTGPNQKRFTWQASSYSWASSENIDIAPNKTYKVNGQTVISSSSLGTVITSAPGLTSLGTLNSLTIGQVYISTNSIGMVNSVPLTLGAGATTTVNFNGRALTNAYTVLPGDGYDNSTVATIGYVKYAVQSNISSQFAMQIDVTGYASSSSDPTMDSFIIDMLNNYLLPPNDPNYGIAPGSRARIIATRMSTTATTAVSNQIGFAGVSVYQAGTTNPVSVVADDRPYTATTPIPSNFVNVDRVVKQYRVNNSYQWEAYPPGAGANTLHLYGSW